MLEATDVEAKFSTYKGGETPFAMLEVEATFISSIGDKTLFEAISVEAPFIRFIAGKTLEAVVSRAKLCRFIDPGALLEAIHVEAAFL